MSLGRDIFVNQSDGIAGNQQFFICGNNKNFEFCRFLTDNSLASVCERLINLCYDYGKSVEFDAEPGQIFTNQTTHFRRVFADAARENNRVRAVHRG